MSTGDEGGYHDISDDISYEPHLRRENVGKRSGYTIGVGRELKNDPWRRASHL